MLIPFVPRSPTTYSSFNYANSYWLRSPSSPKHVASPLPKSWTTSWSDRVKFDGTGGVPSTADSPSLAVAGHRPPMAGVSGEVAPPVLLGPVMPPVALSHSSPTGKLLFGVLSGGLSTTTPTSPPSRLLNDLCPWFHTSTPDRPITPKMLPLLRLATFRSRGFARPIFRLWSPSLSP